MIHVTCRLTAKNRDQLRKPMLSNRVWVTFTFFTIGYPSDSASSSKWHGWFASCSPGRCLSTWPTTGKTSWDLNEARDAGVLGWQWHQLDHTQTICTSLQTDNHTNTSSVNFSRPDALPDAQPTLSKHCDPHTHHRTNVKVRAVLGCPPISNMVAERQLRFFGCTSHAVLLMKTITVQFQLIQISFKKNPSVCSPLMFTVVLPPSDRQRLRFKPCD